jgi:hypothetical protein
VRWEKGHAAASMKPLDKALSGQLLHVDHPPVGHLPD